MAACGIAKVLPFFSHDLEISLGVPKPHRGILVENALNKFEHSKMHASHQLIFRIAITHLVESRQGINPCLVIGIVFCRLLKSLTSAIKGPKIGVGR